MKTIMKTKNIISMAIILATLAFTSCSKSSDSNPVSGEALFTYKANGLSVTFTNTSTVSGTYLWEFGDKNTSTEKDPAHAYSRKGEYTVKLTITDKDGGKHDIFTKINVDKTSPVLLDDNKFDDWANIAEGFAPGTVNQAGIVKVFKYDFDKDMIYFYIKVETNEATDLQIMDMLFDTTLDNTGYKYSLWPKFSGAELLVENSFSLNRVKTNENYSLDFANLNPSGTDWDSKWVYDEKKTAGAQIDGTYKVTGKVIEIEFGVSRTKIPALKGKEIVKIIAWMSNPDWDENGWIPNANPKNGKDPLPKAEGITIDMK